MKKNVYITSISSYFPNGKVENEEMEDFLGMINGKASRVKNIVLKQNGIKGRYYALNKQGEITHTNAELAGNAILGLFKDNGYSKAKYSVLACATSTPDQLLPSHASMVHGFLKGSPLEIYSFSGVCLTSIQALKTCYYSIALGESKATVCSTSELTSPVFLNRNYDSEYKLCDDLKKDPYMAFEKDFMRFILSDGASAVLLESSPNGHCNLKIEWIEIQSFANELPTCMFMAAELKKDGELKGWKEFTPQEIKDRSVMVGKQDIRQLKKHIINYWANHIEYCLQKHCTSASGIKYIIPHVSSMFFYNKLNEELISRKIDLAAERWYTNLSRVGNIGSAAIFSALEELTLSRSLVKGDKILLLVPESGRFSYGTVLLTVE